MKKLIIGALGLLFTTATATFAQDAQKANAPQRTEAQTSVHHKRMSAAPVQKTDDAAQGDAPKAHHSGTKKAHGTHAKHPSKTQSADAAAK
jgi:type IV secretory pathway VirB6-like protein